MALTDATKWTAADLRDMSHSQIEGLVDDGTISEELAAEVLAEDDQKQREQFIAALHVEQAQIKEKEHPKKDDWLDRMSASYQQAYHELINTYDDAQTQYQTIQSDAEKLKTRLRGDIDTAYQFGVQLPDGSVAFFDRRRGIFVDASLQPLNDQDTKQAADDFKQLSPQEQRKNSCYADACYAYADADNIAQTADATKARINQEKADLENCQVEISEKRLLELRKGIVVEEENISGRLVN